MAVGEVDRRWRVSMSGFAIREGDEGRIVASYHAPFAPFDDKRFARWLDDAERICDLHNAAIEAETEGGKREGEG